MSDYQPTPHLPDDEGRRLLSELWALYGETGFNRETGKPLKMPRADADFWKMRRATTKLQQAIIGVAGRFPNHESFQAWLSQQDGSEGIDAYDPLRMHDDMIAAIRDLRWRLAAQEECLKGIVGVLLAERVGHTRDFPTPPPVGRSKFFYGESREGKDA
ncbi:hypothetical protein [Bradyrhizobium sp. AS23.2]|uniref:hypothetical protein n=1 Tax=Bradyrhizobium sp. AS23.2 TaxID=1680155 RepID=UPI00093892F4|nr:hypothetical protein [Bradyrhizobium sp. AS23.2]OKO71891.1 hypothetical protein AC630_31750 [Bradyrhizobium sp. AS23.2]